LRVSTYAVQVKSSPPALYFRSDVTEAGLGVLQETAIAKGEE